jgi:hypothetical protein
MDKDDKSAPLTLTFSEQQWMAIGAAISMRLRAPDCHPIEEENLRPIALQLQRTINHILRTNAPAKILEGGTFVVNFAGQRWVDEEYLYGPNPN